MVGSYSESKPCIINIFKIFFVVAKNFSKKGI